MRIKAPDPIYLQGGEHAVLLLHVLAIAGGRDDLVYQQSANIIVDEINSTEKQKLMVEQGKHLLTIEKNQNFYSKTLYSL